MTWRSLLVVGLLVIVAVIYAPMLVRQHDQQYKPSPCASTAK